MINDDLRQLGIDGLEDNDHFSDAAEMITSDEMSLLENGSLSPENFNGMGTILIDSR